MSRYGFLRIALLTLVVMLVQVTWVLAGTTGSVSGTTRDDHGNPIAAAKVSVISPSQSQNLVTSANGFFSALNLSPDTYTVTGSKDGYDTTSVYGITVQADQDSRVDLTLRPSTKVLGRVTTTATASVVSRTVTGDLYAVNAQAINSYQGAAGGAETLYSQNAVAGSLPGVIRTVGSGGGYGGQGQLSLRGGSFDQVGFELDGVPLNRGFDFYNGTAFLTNGLAGLEVYTGGAPASSGRAMSGYINGVIQRGKYPGGGDFTGVIGSSTFNHTVQGDVYGGTPDNKFTYYVSSLAVNAAYEFGQRGNLDGLTLTVPAGDAGCAAASATNGGFGAACNAAGGLATAITTRLPVSVGSFFSNPYASERDTVANIHWNLTHNNLNDDLQALYVTGTTATPNFYAGQGIDPTLSGLFSNGAGQITWPTGAFYLGGIGSSYNTAALATLTWPSSGNSNGGVVPNNYVDGQTTQYSIEKLGYTRALSQNAFLRVFGYKFYSAWSIDSATQGFNNGDFYQLHNNSTGVTMNFQDQLNDKNLLKLDADYTRDLTLRFNYINYAGQQDFEGSNGGNGEPDGTTLCGSLSAFALAPCTPGGTVAMIRGPYAYWSSTTPKNYDFVISDQWKPSDKLLFDFGVRFDRFSYELMPLQINGANGLAEQAQNQFGQCLFGFNYGASEPCFGYLTQLAANNGQPSFLPGAAPWKDVSGELTFNQVSPRLGVTMTASPQTVVRFSVGRYVQPPNSAFEEYRAAPQFGAGDTISILNRFYSAPGLNFLGVHNILPEDSTNYDLSLEHDFGNGVSAKVTPYFRNTRNQVLNLPVDPANPTFVTGLNVGTARIKGAEFLVRTNRQHENGLSATLAATYTDSKLRFTKNSSGLSFIDIINGVNSAGQCIANTPGGTPSGICGYNFVHGTNFALEDPNGYYSPSFTQAPTIFSPSYDVRWVVNLNLDERVNGFDISPTFNYQSGNPYGEPLLFPDVIGGNNIGPDPYTKTFDAIGSLKGPSALSMNLGVSHDLGKNIKGTVLLTNVFTSIHNQGYAWEYPTSNHVLNYSDNAFYSFEPIGAAGGPYSGANYFAYAPSGISPYKEFVFSVSAKI